MIIIMKPDARDDDIKKLIHLLKDKGFTVNKLTSNKNKIIYIDIESNNPLNINLMMLPGVQKCIPLDKIKRLVDKKTDNDINEVHVGDETIGGKKIVMMAGPCSVENEIQIMEIAKSIKKTGASFLRGGAYKPRTSPYAFQGLEVEGLKLLRQAADQYNLKVISEVTSIRHLDDGLKYCDMIQIGTRNMQNFELLKEIGKTNIPVLLKRARGATINEWLNAAEYILYEGNSNVVLCERGIRTFETATRNTLDISAIPIIKSQSSLPIIVDPSHAAGRSDIISSISKAAIAAGADGLLIEVHNNPKFAVSDAKQQITLDEYKKLFLEVLKISKAIDRIV